MAKRTLAIVLPAAMALNGCGVSGNGAAISTSGAGTVLGDTDSYSPDRLATIIRCYTNKASRENSSTTAPCTSIGDTATQTASPTDPVAPALADFSQQLWAKSDTAGSDGTTGPTSAEMIRRQNQLRAARNEIQGILMTASANRCNEFQQRLRERSSDTLFALGSLGTSLTSAATIFKNASSQILSGLGTATNNIGDQYNKDIMAGVTTNVIIPAINKQRTALAQEIAGRRCMGITSYPLSVSLTDVVRYHAACSLDIGVAAAAAAVNNANKPGDTTTQAAKPQTAATASADQPAKKNGNAKKTARGGGPGKENKAESPTYNVAGGQNTAGRNIGSTDASYGASTFDAANSSALVNAPLVGDSISMQECRPLDENGLLPPTPASDTGAGTNQSKSSASTPSATPVTHTLTRSYQLPVN